VSLIDEALKRASEETAKQEAAKRSGSSRWAPSHIPRAKRSSWKGAAGFAAVFLAGSAAAWLLFGRGHAPTVPAEPAIHTVAPSPAPSPLSVRVSGPAPVAAPEHRGRQRSIAEPVPARPAPSPASGAQAPETPALAPLDHAAPGPPPAPRKTFVRTATLAGGESIELGGIVYSEGNPVALLNGKVVAPGGSVGDFTVVQIRPDRVDFSGNGATFSILLR
jgi:hypothetical protein